MPNRLLIAYHRIWTAYGHWLPNDPRGSGSTVVLSDKFASLGELHYGRKPIKPPRSVVREFQERAAKPLSYSLLKFDQADIQTISASFAEIIAERKYTCYACAIMPDHVHILIRKHRDLGGEMMEYLQDRSRQQFAAASPVDPDHPVWTGGGWKHYLFTPDEIRGVIRYIDVNPLDIGLPKQEWDFVQAYDGWPLHPGHRPNSQYAKRLRGAGR